MAKRSLNRPFKGLGKRLAREQQEREQKAREQQEREQQAREQQEREERAREQQEREQQEREQQAREQQARLEQQREHQAQAGHEREGDASPAPGSFAELAESSEIVPLPPEPMRVPREPEGRARVYAPPPQAPTERYEIEQHKGHIEGRRIDVDPVVIEQLRNSRPRSRLDLHGLPAEQARRRLQRFVLGRYAQRDRDVLVIVGKGLHSPQREGVLRGEVAHWLSEPKMAPFVRAFVSARDEHGGQGALYVRLRTHTSP